MPHISKQKLDPSKQEELFDQMNKIIARLNKTTTPTFLEELLGVEEKIMLSKRLSAIILFIEGNSAYRVWTLLKISPSTAERIRHNYKTGKYQAICSFITKNKTDYVRMLRILETILQAGLSPRGKGRWKRTIRLMTK